MSALPDLPLTAADPSLHRLSHAHQSLPDNPPGWHIRKSDVPRLRYLPHSESAQTVHIRQKSLLHTHRYFFHLCRSHHHRRLLYRLPDRWYHCFLPEVRLECKQLLPLPRHPRRPDPPPPDWFLFLILLLRLPRSLKRSLSQNPSLLRMLHPQILPADTP